MAQKTDYSQPAAYDTEGRPLYLHPPSQLKESTVGGAKPHDAVEVVQVTRANDPVAVTVSPEMKRKHDESARMYPYLNLSDGEYIVVDVMRQPVILVAIWLATALIILFVLFAWWFIMVNPTGAKPLVNSQSVGFVSMIALGLAVLFGVLGWIVTVIYKGNKLFLTNESAIQEIQNSLLAKKEQVINLENVKDVSYDQKGLWPQVFNYGTVRLSTEGDHQEYVFSFVQNPKYYTSVMNNVVEAVQYGRPIESAVEKVKP